MKYSRAFHLLLFFCLPVLAQLGDQIVYPDYYYYSADTAVDGNAAIFDSSQWQAIRNGTLPDQIGAGWYRFTIEVDTALINQPLGFVFLADGGSELYLDGKLLLNSGKAGRSRETEIPVYDTPVYKIVTLKHGENISHKTAAHIITIRHSNFYRQSPIWSNTPGKLWWYFLTKETLLHRIKAAEAQKQRATFHQMFLSGIFLAFALLHLMLFYFHRKLPVNLYFGLMAGFTAISTFLEFQKRFIGSPQEHYWNEALLNAFVILAGLAAIRFIHSLFYSPQQKVFKAFLIAGVLMIVWGFFQPLLPEAIRDYFLLAAAIEIGRTLIQARIQQQRGLIEGVQIITTGAVLAVILILLDSLIEFELLTIPGWNTEFPSVPYASMMLALAVSAALAYTFSKMNRDLQDSKQQLEEEIAEKTRTAENLQTALSEVEELKNRLHAENIYLQDELEVAHNFSEIISESESIKKILAQVEKVAVTDATVLITGESGTGKELIARAVHHRSNRHSRPLVKVNCAALPANLIESELFGHEKGAFTGAIARKIGRFELADNGTIFLDEIGELPLALQSKLLRVLQEGEFERLGSSRTMKVNTRIIAATNRDLPEMIKQETFREDLFYRLNVFPIAIPPLRERREDIPLLVNHFIRKYNQKTGGKVETVSQAVLQTLKEYGWPGNIRELENVIERAIIISPGKKLKLTDWMPETARVNAQNTTATLEDVERAHIISVLKSTNWRVSGEKGAASILGINDKTLHWRIKKLGIQKDA